MKKIKSLSLVALLALSLVSCGGEKTNQDANGSDALIEIALNNRVDSLNYAFGCLNGGDFRTQMIAVDTLNADKVDQFVDAFVSSYGEMNEDGKIKSSVASFFQIYTQRVDGGVLFGDKTITFNNEIFTKNFEAALKNQPTEMSAIDANNTVNTIMAKPLAEGEVRSAEQVEQVNMAFAVSGGSFVRNYLLKEDTTEADIESFLTTLEEYKNNGEEMRLSIEGMSVGSGIYQQINQMQFLFGDPSIPMNADLIKAAVVAAVRNIGMKMNREQAMNLFNEESQKIQQRQMEQQAQVQGLQQGEPQAVQVGEEPQPIKLESVQSNPAAEEGIAFLKDNKNKPGIKETASGLQYKVITMGKGAKPTAQNTVRVHYEGRLLDGTVFDSSYQRGESITFPLSGVIKGWTEGVQLMPVGSKFTFFIPQELAYGARGAGAQIPPYSALIFDVELIGIE